MAAFHSLSLTCSKKTAPPLAARAGHPGLAAHAIALVGLLDQVEAPGHVLVTARGVEAVNAEARRQGLRFPAVGYWSPENICFKTPATGDCNGLFRR